MAYVVVIHHGDRPYTDIPQLTIALYALRKPYWTTHQMCTDLENAQYETLMSEKHYQEVR